MTDHELKSWPAYFAPLLAGLKTAELRKNDRPYQPRDTLTLREWDPATNTYTGRFLRFRIRHVQDVSPWAPGYVLLSLQDP